LLSLFISKKEKLPVALRFCALAVAVAWWLTVSFHILLAFHVFRLSVVCGFAAVSGLIAHFTVLPFSKFLRLSIHDARLLGTWICGSIRRSPVVAVLFAFHLFLMGTMFLYPSTGWDALIYHLTKAGFWIQNGAPFSFEIHGMWDAYIHFFGGGEIFTAWVMLPFHGDFAVEWLDFLMWEFFGFSVYVLARELDIPGRYAWLAAWFVWFLPGITKWLGITYVDIRMHVFLLIALALITRFLKQNRFLEMALAGMAVGIATGCKITSLPLGFFLCIFVLANGLWRTQNRRVFLNEFFLAFFLAIAACAPWMIYNILETGYLLSPFPLHFGSLVLGEGSPAIKASMLIKRGIPYNIGSELKRGLTPLLCACGGTIGFFPIVLLPISLIRLFYKRPMTAVLLAAALFSQIAFYWSPFFSSERLANSTHTARFLFLVPAIAAVLLFFTEPRWKKLFAACLCLISAKLLFPFLRGVEANLWVLLISSILVLLAYRKTWFIFSSRTLGRAIVILLVVLPVFLLPFYFFRQAHRYDQWLRKRKFKEAARAARLADDKKFSHRIAVTATAGLYPFMGSRLQNRLFYIPITRSGEVVQDGNYEGKPISFYVWLARLKENNISHVVCFPFPIPSIELKWIRSHPRYFRMVTGKIIGRKSSRWGLFEVLDEPKGLFEALEEPKK
ncbi:MAG: glycosyltransferase family 39 protein, partial [bacterium]